MEVLNTFDSSSSTAAVDAECAVTPVTDTTSLSDRDHMPKDSDLNSLRRRTNTGVAAAVDVAPLKMNHGSVEVVDNPGSGGDAGGVDYDIHSLHHHHSSSPVEQQTLLRAFQFNSMEVLNTFDSSSSTAAVDAECAVTPVTDTTSLSDRDHVPTDSDLTSLRRRTNTGVAAAVDVAPLKMNHGSVEVVDNPGSGGDAGGVDYDIHSLHHHHSSSPVEQQTLLRAFQFNSMEVLNTFDSSSSTAAVDAECAVTPVTDTTSLSDRDHVPTDSDLTSLRRRTNTGVAAAVDVAPLKMNHGSVEVVDNPGSGGDAGGVDYDIHSLHHHHSSSPVEQQTLLRAFQFNSMEVLNTFDSSSSTAAVDAECAVTPVTDTTSLSDRDHVPTDSDLTSLRRRTNTGVAAAVDVAPLKMNHGGVEVVDNPGSGGDAGGGGKVVEPTSPAARTRNGENRGHADVKFSYRPSVPAHRRIKESPLSSDAIFRQSHAGLFNLCVVVLVAVNSGLIIENLMKYGILIRTGFWFSSRSFRDWPLLMCGLSLPIFSLAAFLVEKSAQKKYIPEPVVICLHILITTSALFVPVYVILRCDSAVLSGVTLMLFACIVWLKLISYAHTNHDLRAISESVDKGDVLSNSLHVDYSDSVNLNTLTYFMVAPTLCYQPSYPRTAFIRKSWVARQFLKLVIFTGVMGFIVEQYINPIVQNSQHPLKGNLLYGLERTLKLSVPNLYVWLCMFYCLFHLWLNILAELLCFGDREFYRDWWNAKTVEEYWRMWNMPVHKWMVRHIYFPCLRNGISKGSAIMISFLVSAILHELCIGVPCHMFKLWAFIGIMFQVPLVLITNYLQNKFHSSMVGNFIFWLSFSILGQPMCILLYYHDMMNRNGKIN